MRKFTNITQADFILQANIVEVVWLLKLRVCCQAGKSWKTLALLLLYIYARRFLHLDFLIIPSFEHY
jgi:hypothetical protein